MCVITITTKAKCKHCKFSESYRPMKKDGTLSKKTKTKCVNSKSPRAYENISPKDFVCEGWSL